MIHVDSISQELFFTVASDQAAVNSGFHVQLMPIFNTDRNLLPWVGVYYGDMRIEPLTLGGGKPWQAELEMFVYVQDAGASPLEAANRMIQVQKIVMSAVNTVKTLNGVVAQLTEFEVVPFERDNSEPDYFYTDEIRLKYEVRG